MTKFRRINRWVPFFVAMACLLGCGRTTSPRLGISERPEASHSPIPVGAPSGAGSSGSGYGIEEGSGLQLRELAEGVACHWVNASNFYQSSHSFERIHDVLKFVFSSEMGDALDEEILHLRICLSTRPLKSVNESLLQSVTPYRLSDIDGRRESPVQLAIRINHDVYIDWAAFQRLNELNQGYLLFHEALHGLIPMSVPDRMDKLRDFVAGFRELEQQVPDFYGSLEFRASFDPIVRARYVTMCERFERMRDEASVRLAHSGSLPVPSDSSDIVRHYLVLGDAQSLNKLFHGGTDPNQPGESGSSLFLEMVWYLQNCYEDASTAACLFMPEIVDTYLRAGANPNTTVGNDPSTSMPVWEFLVRNASYYPETKRLALAKLIFERAINPLGKTSEIQRHLDDMLLDLVTDPYASRAIELVLSWGASVNARDRWGRTPWLVAALWGAGDGGWFRPSSTYVLALLLRHGADPSARDQDGHQAKDLFRKVYGAWRSKGNKELYELSRRLVNDGPPALPAVWERLGKLHWHS